MGTRGDTYSVVNNGGVSSTSRPREYFPSSNERKITPNQYFKDLPSTIAQRLQNMLRVNFSWKGLLSAVFPGITYEQMTQIDCFGVEAVEEAFQLMCERGVTLRKVVMALRSIERLDAVEMLAEAGYTENERTSKPLQESSVYSAFNMTSNKGVQEMAKTPVQEVTQLGAESMTSIGVQDVSEQTQETVTSIVAQEVTQQTQVVEMSLRGADITQHVTQHVTQHYRGGSFDRNQENRLIEIQQNSPENNSPDGYIIHQQGNVINEEPKQIWSDRCDLIQPKPSQGHATSSVLTKVTQSLMELLGLS
ncbi:uncharacterized protein LOC116607111 isoform X2 [Nematostella vectensis]|uniref:uncharacterized protein LOC116607111 isoform X2 n=1 Tax=Nematostella vectensis TaxID=45351 RepID=UPI0020773DA0|nr:uncharacterized protein LOC116607111 isoform X2 [Nematostella vectensis]